MSTGETLIYFPQKLEFSVWGLLRDSARKTGKDHGVVAVVSGERCGYGCDLGCQHQKLFRRKFGWLLLLPDAIVLGAFLRSDKSLVDRLWGSGPRGPVARLQPRPLQVFQTGDCLFERQQFAAPKDVDQQ